METNEHDCIKHLFLVGEPNIYKCSLCDDLFEKGFYNDYNRIQTE